MTLFSLLDKSTLLTQPAYLSAQLVSEIQIECHYCAKKAKKQN